jgi:hypothetical protein
LIQFHWPGIAFTVTQAVVYSLTIWLTISITRWTLRRRHRVDDREELVDTIREKQGEINRLTRERDDARAEAGRMRATMISNTELAARLLQNHEAVKTGVDELRRESLR